MAKLTANKNNDKPRQDTAFGPTEALSLIVGFPSDVTTLNRTVAAAAKLQLNDQLHCNFSWCGGHNFRAREILKIALTS